MILLAGKYSDLAILNEVIKASLELKEIETDTIEVTAITVDNYKESFDSNFELYSSELAFSCKFLNK
nr:hypothetical protein [uncultured Draconibacterium sp.]